MFNLLSPWLKPGWGRFWKVCAEIAEWENMVKGASSEFTGPFPWLEHGLPTHAETLEAFKQEGITDG